MVADHSSTTTPTFYRITAVWSSQEGSLLLWIWLLSLWSSLVLFLTRRRLREVAPWATATLLGFAGLLRHSARRLRERPSPRARPRPPRASGLNPLLRHPSMMIHPPMLYSGYTLFAIPFAFCVGALIARRVDAEWISSTRRFTLAAWALLGIGILLGARWSYSELGWGGYWAWDPVENASLMPWLTGTAFLHSVMIQERRGMLKVWNVVAGPRDRRAGDPRHVPRALRDPRLDPRLRRLDARRALRDLHRRARRALGGAGRRAPRRLCAPAPARLAAVARVGVPTQQPRARGAVLRDLLGHVLPADLRGGDRRQGRRSGRRGSTATPSRSRSRSCCSRASAR